MLQSHVRNDRSHEDHALGPENYAPFLGFTGRSQVPDDCLSTRTLDELRQFGDAWDDGFQSLRNLMLQLYSVAAVHRMAMACKPNVTVFARPDMIYHDAVQHADVEWAAKTPMALAIPAWQWWRGGLNDRFAVCGTAAATTYAQRLLMALPFCRGLKQPLHSERLLRVAATHAGLDVRAILLRASRVRVSGQVQRERFEGVRRRDSPA